MLLTISQEAKPENAERLDTTTDYYLELNGPCKRLSLPRLTMTSIIVLLFCTKTFHITVDYNFF